MPGRRRGRSALPRVELPTRFAVWTAVAPLPLLAFAIDGHLSRPEGGLLVIWSVVALVGLARSGRSLLAGEDEDDRSSEDDRVRRPGLRLFVGLALLTGGGWLIAEGLRTTIRQFGVPQTLLGNTALAATALTAVLFWGSPRFRDANAPLLMVYAGLFFVRPR